MSSNKFAVLCPLFRVESYQKKAELLSIRNSKLEHLSMQLELENRELKYAMEQAREGGRAKVVINTQLKDQLDKMEGKLGKEIGARQASELKIRELEVSLNTLRLSNQQLASQREELASQLQAESEARALQEGIFREQVSEVWEVPLLERFLLSVCVVCL